MRIVVMSDTHLGRLTDDFRRLCSQYCEGADLVIHLGDWVSPDLLDYMEQYNLFGVAGNTDGDEIRSRLPLRRIVSVRGYRIGMTHGWGSMADMRRNLRGELPGVNVILFGHTHQPVCLEEDGVLWLNPGSVFMGRGKVARSIGMLHVGETLEGEIVSL